MEESADSEFHFTKQTGDEAAAALSRMNDVDVILEMEGGSIKYGTDQGERNLGDALDTLAPKLVGAGGLGL